MISLAQQDELILDLYDHAADGELSSMFAAWPRTLESSALHTMLIDPRAGVVESSVCGEVTGAPAEYELQWRDKDPRMALAVAQPGRVLSDAHHIDPVAFECSDVYHAVLRPFDLRYSLFGTLHLASGHVVAQAAIRGFDPGSYEAPEIAVMEHLWRHLRRAADLRLELHAMSARVADLNGALDAMPSPVFVLDARGHIQQFNAAAERVLAARDPLFSRQGKLVTCQSRETSRLRAAITQAVRYADAGKRGVDASTHAPSSVITIARGKGNPLSLVVHPIRPRIVLRARTEARARVLIVVHDPDARTRVDRDLVMRIYGLTPTEGALAAAIAAGNSLAEFAELHGCSEGTARVHLKRIFEKTGTRRQPELVHRILASAALHQVEVGS
jgi:DNA-binding CsgD family transcriptional regulator/PAS domain-containing protein